MPLPTLLSQALIAFTIEFDNEFEHRMPHRTTAARAAAGLSARGPWLVSMAMWSNFLRYVPADGIPFVAVEANARITNLAGLERWGYIHVERLAAAKSGWTVRLKRGGVAACAVWAPLAAEIESRWRDRFGAPTIDAMRVTLAELADPGLPAYLPVVGYADGMRSDHVGAVIARPADDLAARLSRVLLAFALAFEERSRLSMPMCVDIVRVLSSDGVRSRDLPGRSGCSREGVAAAVKYLVRAECATVAGGIVALTPKGTRVQARTDERIAAIEEEWRDRYGVTLDRLREALPQGDRLALGLRPFPDGWRARNPYLAGTRAVLADPAAALPRHPMVLHRGGYPDGS